MVGINMKICFMNLLVLLVLRMSLWDIFKK